MTRNLATDTGIVLTRELKPVIRNPFSVIFTLIQPLVFLGLFAPLLPDDVGSGSALQWFVPGIVVMSCLFGTSTTGANLQAEMISGSHERMLVTPLRRPALIIGRALKEIVPMVAQTAVIVVIVVPFGFDLHPVGAVLGLMILAVFSIGLGALSYALALAVKDQEWMFWAVQQTLLFPMLLLAGMLLPVDGGPSWLETASRFDPLTYVVDAERLLFNGEIASSTVVGGVISALAVAAFGLAVGTRAMQRSS